jgi:subtilisin family serine protease
MVRRGRAPSLGPRATAVLLTIVCSALLLHARVAGQSARISPWLDIALRQGRAGDQHLVWVYFSDKGIRSAQDAAPPISARARTRRATRGRSSAAAAIEDASVPGSYVTQVAGQGARIRHTSRWLNAVSAEATAAQIQAIAALSFVDRIDVVRRYRRVGEEPIVPLTSPPATEGRWRRATVLDYGSGFSQVAQIRVPELHDRGLSGDGILVAMFDAGFPNLAHEAFSSMRISAEHDFVAGGDSVRATTASHGTATLSVIGGRREGQLIGPAFGARFVLARTEDDRSETPVEEDNWAAAAEWAEAMGVDVISSSLGYLEFDFPFTSYTDRDMDGETAVTTKAAAMAAARGVVVVVSAGNGGFNAAHNTLGAPADAKSAVSVGAVDIAGLRAPFSSVGPTADGRIKPDVAALGVRAKVAGTASLSAYGAANGTSFSCPLTAGVVALLLEAHPTYTVDQVLTALRSTASQSDSPDTLLGWGIVDAVRAVDVRVPGDSRRLTVSSRH